MQVFEMVVLIVAICVFGNIIRSYFNRGKPDDSDAMRESFMEDMGLETPYYTKNKIDPYLVKIDAMEERIQVLERIATDKGRNLASEIDNLR